jgi:hypothetical protein
MFDLHDGFDAEQALRMPFEGLARVIVAMLVRLVVSAGDDPRWGWDERRKHNAHLRSIEPVSDRPNRGDPGVAIGAAIGRDLLTDDPIPG